MDSQRFRTGKIEENIMRQQGSYSRSRVTYASFLEYSLNYSTIILLGLYQC